MKSLSRLSFVLSGSAILVATSYAQVPDLLNALDAGSRAMAMGGANSATNVDTFAAYYNPAALAYLDTRAADIAYRNLPTSRSSLTGDLSRPRASNTDAHSGGSGITHAGFATPVRELFGRGSGTLAVAYTVGGYVDDHAHATTTGLTDGPTTTTNYELDRRAKASFYSLSYGKAVSSSLSFGLGLVVASQEVHIDTSGSETIAGLPQDLGSHASSTGTGVGVIAGALFSPVSLPAWSFGLSYRSPIDLSGNSETQDEYDRIPGRLLFGATWRREGFRGGKDYLLLGGQVQSFLGGESSTYFDRNTQTTFGFGAEYNVGIASGRVPLRFGFTTVPSGGSGYGSRNAFTFGLGFRPNRLPVGLDLSYAVPEGGGYDLGIAASYRFK